MADHVGSVTAKISLDTTEFESAIKTLKGDIKDLKESFAQKTGSNGLIDDVKRLKEEIDSLKGKVSDYKTTIKNLRDVQKTYNAEINRLKKELADAKKGVSEFTKDIKEEQSVLDAAGKAADKYVLKTEKIGKRNKYKKPSPDDFTAEYKVNPEVVAQVTLETWKNAYFQYDRMVKESAEKERLSWLTKQSAMRNAMEAFVGMTRNLITEQKKAFATDGGYNNYLNTLSKVRAEFGKINNSNFTKLSANIYENGQLILNMGTSWRTAQERITQSTTLIKTSFKEVDGELEKVTTEIGRVSEVLLTFNFKLLELADSESVAANNAVKLASAIQRMNVQGTGNWQGRQGGYSNYIASINKINQSLTRQAELEAKLKAQKLDQYYAKVGSASAKYWNQIRQGTVNLNTYKSNLTQITQELQKQSERSLQLASAQQKLWQKYHTTNLNTYKSNMTEINQKLAEQTNAMNKNANSTGRGQKSMREFGTTMGKAEAYSNNLYRGLQKVRSVIVSFKTIVGAFGGMALWSFASDLISGVTETYKAKNEMESLLNKNTKVNANGVQIFNKELDNTISKFQKINKYSLGETTASIGLEFNLTAKEMAKSMDVISMIQSEYVRAGRTTEEAALAVKDILQGEFMRLSRETGVGKDDLKEKYGWNGNKDDVMGLMKALEKAGKDRHWDVFAAKATSLNDVITMTQSRFGEFGADLATEFEPIIVGTFNSLMGAIDGLKGHFDGMNSFGKIFTVGGVSAGSILGIATAFMVLKRNMGLADIATMGFNKSLATAVFGLKKSDVAMYGFKKTLLSVISGTDASTVSNLGFAKSIAAKILGVKQETAAEHGLINALVQSKAHLKGEALLLQAGSKQTMGLAQKVAYLTNDMTALEAEGLKTSTAIRKIVTSTKLLKIAFLGLGLTAVLAVFAGVVAKADTARKAVEKLNKIVDNGKSISDKAQKNVDKYTAKLAELTKGTKKYKQVNDQLRIAKLNKEDIDNANKAIKAYQKDYKNRKKEIKDTHDMQLNKSYGLIGNEYKSMVRNYEAQAKAGIEVRNKALDAYNKRLYQSSQHMNEHIKQMKEAGASQKDMSNYVAEYNYEAENTAKLWQKFNEGDLKSGFYAVISELKLIWIDLWNNDKFVSFWKSVQKTWEDLKPTAYAIKDALTGVVNVLLEFFSTDVGRWVGTITLFGTAIGVVGLKIGKWVSGSKTTFEVLKNLGSRLKDGWKSWRKYGDEAEEALEKTKGKTPTSTGGINGDIEGTASKTPFKETLKNDAKNYARAAVAIAAGMALITEAIVLLRAPMSALTELGWQFKQWEPDIRKGIEGLTLIAPTVTALLVPVTTLAVVLEKFGVETTTIIKGGFKAAIGIAVGLLLVTETIVMLHAPLWAIGTLGNYYKGIEAQVKQGTEAMQVVSNSLQYLLPFVPAMVLGVALVAAMFAALPIGAAALGAVVAGIALGMGLVAEAIYTLQIPLLAIGEVGKNFNDLSNVKQGAEALKVTAEALGYVESGMSSLAGIAWDALSSYIAQLVGVELGVDLSGLTGENGFFKQLETFTKQFNEITITPIDSAKVTTLNDSATGINTVKDALVTVKEALKNLPNFEIDNRTTNEKVQDNVSGANVANGVTNYFEQLQQPVDQLNEFITKFNKMEVTEVDSEKVSVLQGSTNAIKTIGTAIDTVKTALGTSVDAEWNANMASGGWFAAAAGFLVGNGGASSSIKGGLDELYNSVKDIMDFNSRISGLTSEGSGDTSSVANISNMVSALSTQINNLKNTLSNSVPTVKSTAKNMGSSIVTGFKEGITGLDATFKTSGEGFGTKLTDGFKSKVKFKDTVSTEITYTFTYLDGKKQDFYDKGAMLGSSLSQGFKDNDGLDQHSPGKMARAVDDELGFIGSSLTGGVNNLPQMASSLANSLSSNFNLDFGLSNIKLPNITNFTDKLSVIPSTVNSVKTQVSSKFGDMKTNIQNSFTNIVGNTRTSMASMKSATLKNIGGIRTSWRGMQDALIASADHIKTQTSTKINKLKNNLGSFWNKIKHPDQLISGAAGGKPRGSIRRRFTPHTRSYAGSPLFKSRKSTKSPDDYLKEAMECELLTGKQCYAGWNFNWTNKISKKFKGWNTHFGKFNLDSHLNVGKFQNSNFPVKGKTDVFKDYVAEIIKGTTYDFYFNSRYDSPADALRSGSFNCWDGTQIILALARAFGLGGNMGHGTWNGIGHVFARIPGIGVIDPTALQQRGTFKSSAVKGYSAGGGKKAPSNKVVHNHGDTVINVNAPVYGVDDLHAEIENGVKKANRKLFRNSLSGV